MPDLKRPGFFLLALATNRSTLALPDFPCELSSPAALPIQVTSVLVTVALLGLCARVAAAPTDVPTRTNELDETPSAIPADLDFASPLIGLEVVFDPYSDPPDDPDSLVILPLNTTLILAPEPSTSLLFPWGLACLAILFTIRRLSRLLGSLKKPSRPGRRKVRRELRMMA